MTVDGLVKLCTIPEHRRFFQALGMAVGIKAWADDFKTTLTEAHRKREMTNNISSSTSQPIDTFGLLKVCAPV